MSEHSSSSYYVPSASLWPLFTAAAVGCVGLGAALILRSASSGPYLFLLGAVALSYVMFLWFRDVIRESLRGMNSEQMHRSYRWGMIWFIFSELMFFAAFFGALFYARMLSVPWLGGEGAKVMTHALLWPNFTPAWPLLQTPDPTLFPGAKAAMGPEGLPTMNTLILLSSGLTLTIAHWALTHWHRRTLMHISLIATWLLGYLFIALQALEYVHAFHALALTPHAGIYGSTFFMLTGFHGAHVLVGSIILMIISIRGLCGHFSAHDHFAFEAGAWYWHFVDAVWLLLYLFVYWL